VQTSALPWDGAVRIVVQPEGADEFTVALRVPSWCERPTVQVNDEVVAVGADQEYVTLRRRWRPNDTIRLTLPLDVRQVAADLQVAENVGRRAVQRGPVVYCFEDADNPCRVDQVAIPVEARFEPQFRPELLGGVTVLRVTGQHHGVTEGDDGFQVTQRDVPLTAVPYYAWDNREPGHMVVWVPTELAETTRTEGATVAIVARASASHCWERDSVSAVNDNILPAASNDHDIPRLTWWDHRGTTEWVQYDFQRPKRLASAEVYWFDDTGRGSCRVPAAWRLLVQDGDAWRPVRPAGAYGVAPNDWNRVGFEPVTTTSVRLEVTLQPGCSGGILEWRLP
jgi:hypothetical protein